MHCLIFTGTSAEWGLMQPLAYKLKTQIKVTVLATGSHMAHSSGWTVNEIPDDFNLETIEMLMDTDTDTGVAKSLGMLSIQMPEKLKEIDPDFMLILGDRSEALVAAQIASILRIPIVQLHAGEKSGNYDDKFRNAITCLSTMVFAATPMSTGRASHFCSYAVTSGSLGCEGYTPRTGDGEHVMVCYHPNTSENESVDPLIKVLKTIKDKVIVLASNSDNGGKEITDKLKKFCEDTGNEFITRYPSRDEYIKALQKSKYLIGNSSSGIIECPALGVPTVNIGTRQKGRERATSVVDVEKVTVKNIKQGIKTALSPDLSFNGIPYRGGNVAEKITEHIVKYFGSNLKTTPYK